MAEYIIDKSRPSNSQSAIQIDKPEGVVVLGSYNNSEVPVPIQATNIAQNAARASKDTMVNGQYTGKAISEYVPDTFPKKTKLKINNIARIDQRSVGCCLTYQILNNINSQMVHAGILSADESIDFRNFWRCNGLPTINSNSKAQGCYDRTAALNIMTGVEAEWSGVGPDGTPIEYKKDYCWKIPIVKKDACIQQSGEESGGDHTECCAQKFVKIKALDYPEYWHPLDNITLTNLMERIDHGNTVEFSISFGKFTSNHKSYQPLRKDWWLARLIKIHSGFRKIPSKRKAIENSIRQWVPDISDSDFNRVVAAFENEVFSLNAIPDYLHFAITDHLSKKENFYHSVSVYGYAYNSSSGMVTLYINNTWADQNITHTFHESEAAYHMSFYRIWDMRTKKSRSLIYGEIPASWSTVPYTYDISECGGISDCDEERSGCDVECFDCSSGSYAATQYVNTDDHTPDDIFDFVNTVTSYRDFKEEYRAKKCHTSFEYPLVHEKSDRLCPELECYGCRSEENAKDSNASNCCEDKPIPFDELSLMVKKYKSDNPARSYEGLWKCSIIPDKFAKPDEFGVKKNLSDEACKTPELPDFQSDCIYCTSTLTQAIDNLIP